MRRFLPLLVLLCCLLADGARADDARRPTPDAWVEDALAAAGENRSELSRVLTHYWAEGDERKLEAARFLIANMPAHGYVIAEFQDEKGNADCLRPAGLRDVRGVARGARGPREGARARCTSGARTW